MTELLASLSADNLKKALLQCVSWRFGDSPELPGQLAETLSVPQNEALAFLELLCPPLDYIVDYPCSSAEDVYGHLSSDVSVDDRKKLAAAAFEARDKVHAFCVSHNPSLARVLYHDWRLDTHVATESLGRIARPVASITLRVQPPAHGALLLPPLKSITLELGKDMIGALSAGFDRLQLQLEKFTS
jgi:hypothetical protein